jgi:uncharacterized protein (UPF0248 family)
MISTRLISEKGDEVTGVREGDIPLHKILKIDLTISELQDKEIEKPG